MKVRVAAIAAALLLLSACAFNSASTQQTPAAPVVTEETVSDSAAQAQDTVTLPSIPEGQKPVVDDAPASDSFTDEPYDVQMDFEEVVSLSLSLPKFTLDSEDAENSINSVFEKLSDNLQQYAQTTVYETAQSKNTIGFIDGSYMASLEDGVLSVTYTVEERYASDDGQTVHENIYRFDTASGEQLDA